MKRECKNVNPFLDTCVCVCVCLCVCVCVCVCVSHVPLFVTSWTVANQAPLSMEFFRQEYWSRLPFYSPGDLPNPGIEPWSPALQADSLPSEPPIYREAYIYVHIYIVYLYLYAASS